MKKAPALVAAVLGCAGIALAGIGIGAGANGSAALYRVSLPGLASDSAALATAPASSSVITTRTFCDTSGDGIVHAVGEVANGLNLPISRVRLKATLFAGDTEVATATGDALLPVISSLRGGPFDIPFPTGAPEFDSCLVQVTGYDDAASDALPAYGLEVSLGIPTADADGRIHIAGQVRNRAARASRSARVWVALTGGDGEILMVAAASVQPAEMSPGGAGTFEVVFPGGAELDAFGTRVYAWADQPLPTPTPTPTPKPPGQ